jgi:hypothetical protein
MSKLPRRYTPAQRAANVARATAWNKAHPARLKQAAHHRIVMRPDPEPPLLKRDGSPSDGKIGRIRHT